MDEVRTLDEMGLPSILEDFCIPGGGLVLLGGPKDSGKSTTAAAMLEHINRSDRRLIATIENPIIDFCIRNSNCLKGYLSPLKPIEPNSVSEQFEIACLSVFTVIILFAQIDVLSATSGQ